jgi:hypothetical protein
MARIFPIVTLILSVIVLLWRFAPFPAGTDPDGKLRLLGLLAIGAVMVLWSILALRRGLAGDGSLLTALALLVLPAGCFFSYGGGRIAGAFAVIAFCVVVFTSFHELRDAA